DVLIGTQMLAKGLDLPSVTLVGVVLAEVGLNFPDYHATERTFQLLMQVAGRAGRGLHKGKVILQTYQPEHYVILSAANQNYEDFYHRELALRKKISYPPFGEIVRLEFRHHELNRVRMETQKMLTEIQGWIKAESIQSLRVVGPVPCFYQRLAGNYRWQILLIGESPQRFLMNRSLKNGWRSEINPISLL
ncbi:MAG: primosomal protein N', partial [Anaerolineales bacterium]